jgi:hypothetical protein
MVYPHPTRLLVLDIDGTTLAKGETALSETLSATFATLNSRGVRVALATSRAPQRVTSLGLNPTWCPEVIVCGGGAVLDVATGELRDVTLLPPPTLQSIGWELHKMGEGDEVAWAQCAPHGPWYAQDVVRVASLPDGTDWGLKLSARLRTHDPHSTAELLRSAVGEAFSLTSSGRTNLEVAGPGASKRAAVVRLARSLHLASRDVVGVGNGPNDVDFLEWVGWSVAVAPLDQELGRAVDEVIEAPDLASWITRHFRL